MIIVLVLIIVAIFFFGGMFLGVLTSFTGFLADGFRKVTGHPVAHYFGIPRRRNRKDKNGAS